MGRRFYGHYYLILLPQLAILSAWGFLTIKNTRSKHIVSFLIILWALFFFLTRIDGLNFRRLFGIHDSDWNEISTLQRPIGEYLKENTAASDTVMIWGFASPIYYCAERLPATRFLSPDMLVNRVSGGSKYKRKTYKDQDQVFLKGLWDEFFLDLENRRPVYIGDMSGSEAGAYKDLPLANYPIKKWMDEKGYIIDDKIEGALLYRIPR